MTSRLTRDLIISGNGAVGCTLALLLSRILPEAHKKLVVLEKRKIDSSFPPDFPTRNFSLTKSSIRTLLEALDEPGRKELDREITLFDGMQIWEMGSQSHLQFGFQNRQTLRRKNNLSKGNPAILEELPNLLEIERYVLQEEMRLGVL